MRTATKREVPCAPSLRLDALHTPAVRPIHQMQRNASPYPDAPFYLPIFTRSARPGANQSQIPSFQLTKPLPLQTSPICNCAKLPNEPKKSVPNPPKPPTVHGRALMSVMIGVAGGMADSYGATMESSLMHWRSKTPCSRLKYMEPSNQPLTASRQRTMVQSMRRLRPLGLSMVRMPP